MSRFRMRMKLRSIGAASTNQFVRTTSATSTLADSTWNVLYSIRTHQDAFDAARHGEARFAWEVCAPLRAKEVPTTSEGLFGKNRVSFFSVDVPNIIITSIKAATYGEGMILKFQEIAGATTQAILRSDYFQLSSAMETTILEEDIAPLPLQSSSELALGFGPNEIRPIRLLVRAPPNLSERSIH